MPSLQSVLFHVLAYLGLATADYVRFSTDQRGFFLQEQPSVNANPPDYAKTSLGLIPRSYTSDLNLESSKSKTQWERFTNFVQRLNQNAGSNVHYKVLFLARHGESYHNLAEKYYGSHCWDCYWSQKDGNGSLTWKDSHLTPKGIGHTLKANNFWKDTAVKEKIALPEVMYTSPLFRTLQTVNLTFGDSPILKKSKGIFVSEDIREPINACTCAWRSPKSVLQAQFPLITFDKAMKEADPFWTAGKVESQSAKEFRVSKFLETISRAPETFVSVTSHGALIAVFLQVIGHPNPKFNLTTGQIVPALIRTEIVKGEKPKVNVAPPATAETCPICGPA